MKKSLFLIIYEYTNEPPLIQVEQFGDDHVTINYYPTLGYDLCDFIELERTDIGINTLYKSNYLKNENDDIIYIQNEGETISLSSSKYSMHPYFYFNLYDEIKDIDNDMDIDINKNKETFHEDIFDIISGRSAYMAHWELSQLFALSDIEGITLGFFEKFIQDRILLPKFTFGIFPVIGFAGGIEDAYYIGFRRTLESRRNELSSVKRSNSTIYHCDNLIDLVFAYTYHILKMGYIFKKCNNCGKWFVPYHRSDTLYCDRFAPQDENKTCKQFGTEKAYLDNLQKNESARLYRKIYQKLQMRKGRNPGFPKYTDMFDEYKRVSKQYKQDIKNGIKTETEYLSWLKNYDKK